jgi:hypothetical protein
MNPYRHLIAVIVFIAFCFSSFSQSDTCNFKITLLTCGPGEDLYALFGHSALRVKDFRNRTDVIYNYGTFDFDDPDFYVKFVKGKLLYFVSIEQFDSFFYSYQLENRYIIEQDLKLTCEEKERLSTALQTNAKEENKYYQYEFLFDNCSTRLRDIVVNNAHDSVSFRRILPIDPPTFRDMIHEYLNRGKQYWSKFGIDLALGSRVDRKVQNTEAMFLPDYLMKGFDSSLLRNSSMVSNRRVILQNVPPYNQKGVSLFTPLSAMILLLIFGVLLTFSNKKSIQRVLDVFDTGFFLMLGLAGCFLLFMWFGTDHELCRDNYNLLWAIPTHAIAAFFLGKRKQFLKIYFAVTALLSILILVLWPLLPQGLNIAFIPLILLAGTRSLHRWKKI